MPSVVAPIERQAAIIRWAQMRLSRALKTGDTTTASRAALIWDAAERMGGDAQAKRHWDFA